MKASPRRWPRWLLAFGSAAVGLWVGTGWSAPIWGRLANPGFAENRMKATLFFAAKHAMDRRPTAVRPHPGSPITRSIRLIAGIRTGPAARQPCVCPETNGRRRLNVVFMSSWGEDFLPCSTGWVPYAPMQTAPQAHDELFASVAGTSLLIVPFIESRGDWTMRAEFPTWTMAARRRAP